jgi:hypothetical protein
MNHLEVANRVAEDKLRAQIELMRKLHTAAGFYQYWFDNLPFHDTHTACFNAVNAQYNELFGAPRYADYRSFSVVCARINKKP